MEKISGIVPASSRVRGVNMKDSQPLRPGTPTFGRRIGASAAEAGKKLTTAEKAVAAHDELMKRRSGDAHKPKIITEMADDFFLKNQTEAGAPISDVDIHNNMDIGPTSARSAPRELSVPDLPEALRNTERPPNEERALLAEADAQAYDYTPPGTHLDVQV